MPPGHTEGPPCCASTRSVLFFPGPTQRYAASAAGRDLELLLLVPEVGEPPLFTNNKAGLQGLRNTIISPEELSAQCV